ncbi:peptidyl-dipeptidase Dcp [Pseudoduganella flava]|uniref:Dipeptidyl carboxypeptidase n=1 Tax=Pseudoduganella flava TaxID=871742 RepID=A0A562PGC8_9BURK|nr:M3 family metallopeptidase [Pseudoduganella flava]QGZ40214.1 dipeptidyl carboxypeptidase II [Pseudoduganella flava]TWI43393.1 peptidyl-dipeptidase Dcp [Pseudoduganella flava]
MTPPRKLALAAGLALAFSVVHAAPAAKPATTMQATAANPLITVSPLPFHYPQFDQIRDEHFPPAFQAGMDAHLKEIAVIANNPQPATFENTIVAMEKSGVLLHRVATTFSNLQTANTNDKLDEIDRDMSPKLAAHSDTIHMNAKLFKRVETLYGKRDKLGLDAESKYLLERYYQDFVLAGAKLSAKDKEKLKALNGQIATLQTTFTQNVLKELNASALVVDTREELAGLPEAAINAAATAAKERGLDGKFVIALTNTTGQPPLGELTNPQVRARLMAASLARGSHGGEFDNRAVVQKLVKARAEQAQLLGFENFAAYSLADQTAKHPSNVNKLLGELAKPAVNNAKKEAADLEKVAGGPVTAADWEFYADKVRAQRFAFDEKQLKPYFEMNNVLANGVFFAANKLYGITLAERKDLPVYNPDVRTFDVTDADGKPLALLIVDMYARGNKQGGAWMNEYVSQSSLLGEKPVVGFHLNVPKPPAGEPTLLTFDEVKTAFHEFGHVLHGMFSNVKYPRFSGTNVPRDFVEYPSQVNEMWAVWPEVLANYAKHYQTGAPMPKELLDKITAARKFNQGYATTEYLSASLLDQKWHQIKPSEVPDDVLAFEAKALKDAGVDFPLVPPRYRTTYFSHSFSGGYSAGYYAYLWAEKLDADSVVWFKENGGLLRKNGDWFRKTLLSRGGTADAMELFRNFRGRDAVIEPLLERRGLNAQ